MNANEKKLPGESLIADAELATARGGALTIDWKEIVERLKDPPPVPPPSPTWPAPTPSPWPWLDPLFK